ncbi:MAG: glycosyltransferase [Pyrinomonadaceae bacterium]
MSKSLYLCYFGVREPLVQTQVLPYLREIMKGGVKISLLTFEPELRRKWTSEQIKAERDKFAAEGIDWYCLGYHKWPSAPATAYDIFRGAWFIRRIIQSKKIDILHGRVHVPTLMGAIARKFSRRKPKLLFDIRGFFPEEYTDAGTWPENGWLFRSAKRVERWLLKEADGFVVLTEKARGILFPESIATGLDQFERPVEVIPCCVDLERFNAPDEAGRAAMREMLGVADRKVVTYVGSFGGWYMTDEMIGLFAAAHEIDASTFALILTQRETEKIVAKLREAGFSDGDFLVKSVAPDEIAGYLSAADVAISLIKACYSKLSSSPTKIAEYLACGVPIITNRGVGDVAELIEKNGVGVVIDRFDPESYTTALRAVGSMGEMREKCRITAKSEFDLHSIAGKRYRLLYNILVN